MDDQPDSQTKSQEIINLLKQYSGGGLKFEEAQEKLLSQGYSQADITLATDDYQYGSTQVSDISPKVATYFQDHPEQAFEDGKNLLKAQRKEELADERNQAVLDAFGGRAAGEFGVMGIDAQVEYESKFANDVGISFWLLVVLGVVIDGASFLIVDLLNISGLYYIVNGVLSILLLVLLVKRMK